MSVESYILKPGEFVKGGKLIHKFMPIENALLLLNQKYIWLSNPKRWKDPYESRFISAKYGDGRNFGLQGRVFCSCFTDNTTSEASWKAYSDSTVSVKFAFRRAELMNVIDKYAEENPNCHVFFDTVEYMQTKDIDKPLTKIPFNPKLSSGVSTRNIEFKERLLMLKRKAFEYEREYRLIVLKPTPVSELTTGIKMGVPDLSKLIHSITFDPYIGGETYALLKAIFCDKYDLQPNQIQKSNLYTVDSSKIVVDR